MLYVVMPGAIRFPNVNLDTLNRVAMAIFHSADAQKGMALGIVRHFGPGFKDRRIVRVEWT
jgi:hypothetical protein